MNRQPASFWFYRGQPFLGQAPQYTETFEPIPVPSAEQLRKEWDDLEKRLRAAAEAAVPTKAPPVRPEITEKPKPTPLPTPTPGTTTPIGFPSNEIPEPDPSRPGGPVPLYAPRDLIRPLPPKPTAPAEKPKLPISKETKQTVETLCDYLDAYGKAIQEGNTEQADAMADAITDLIEMSYGDEANQEALWRLLQGYCDPDLVYLYYAEIRNRQRLRHASRFYQAREYPTPKPLPEKLPEYEPVPTGEPYKPKPKQRTIKPPTKLPEYPPTPTLPAGPSRTEPLSTIPLQDQATIATRAAQPLEDWQTEGCTPPKRRLVRDGMCVDPGFVSTALTTPSTSFSTTFASPSAYPFAMSGRRFPVVNVPSQRYL